MVKLPAITILPRLPVSYVTSSILQNVYENPLYDRLFAIH